MIQKIKSLLLIPVLMIVASGSMSAVITPQVVSAQSSTSASCNSGFLGFPAWYRGLTDDSCNIKSPDAVEGGLSGFIWLIGLNVLDMAMVFINYGAWMYFIYGGFLMMFSSGNAANAEKARTVMLYSMIGLVMSFGAISIVSFIMNNILPTAQPSPETVFVGAMNIVYFAAGVIAVIMIILSGFKFIDSVYDPANIVQARNRLLYTVVGLIAIIVAYAVTNFIVGSFK
jgi:hypothetical protein